MPDPVISIIGTVYNQAKLAERSLDIWCRQNFDKPYEIIILDDGSTDHTAKMIKSMQNRYPGIIRYFYFDEPNLIRNCTLLFNTAIKRIMRSDIAVIQWYDRIPGTFNALNILYEPHLYEDKICVSFLSRFIYGSSSRDVASDDYVDFLLSRVDWREDPMELEKVMGVPGSHCYPHTMNESSCFSIKKKHFEAIGGYDERYVKVANYSNIELYGRLKNFGINVMITDTVNFHQPHGSNRSDIQLPIESDSVILRNTRIRKDWGSILPEKMVPEDRHRFSFVVENTRDEKKIKKTFSGLDMEVIVESDYNIAYKKAVGKYVLFITDYNESDFMKQLEAILGLIECAKDIGCVGTWGGDIILKDDKFIINYTKSARSEVVFGNIFAFVRKTALRNGLLFPDRSDCPDPFFQMIDFSKQMLIWGGRSNLSLTSVPVHLSANLWNWYQKRWEYFFHTHNGFHKPSNIELEEPMCSNDKKISVLSRYLSGSYESVEQLLHEENVPEIWLHQWRLEYNAKYYLHFINPTNRDYRKNIADLNIIAVIPARSGSKGLKKKALYPLNGKPLIAHTIEACKESQYVDKILVSTDDREIAEIAVSYGANVPFLRPDCLAHDYANLSHVMVHATTWMEMVEDYWYDFLLNLSPTYPLRTGKDIDIAFERIYHSDFRSLQSIDDMKPNTNVFYDLDHNFLKVIPIKRNAYRKIYRQSLFIGIMSRRPNYHIPINDYQEYISSPKFGLAYEVDMSKAIDIDSLSDIFICENIININEFEHFKIKDMNASLARTPKPSHIKQNHNNLGVLSIIRVDNNDFEYEYDGIPLFCKSIINAMESSYFSNFAIIGDSDHVQSLSNWARIPCIQGNNLFRLDGFPRKKTLKSIETAFQQPFEHVCVIDARSPFVGTQDMNDLCQVYFERQCLPTISVSSPEVHPYWCKCVQNGVVVPAYRHESVGHRQNLESVYIKDRALRIASQKTVYKGQHIRPMCGHPLDKRRAMRIESVLDYLKALSHQRIHEMNRKEWAGDALVLSNG